MNRDVEKIKNLFLNNSETKVYDFVSNNDISDDGDLYIISASKYGYCNVLKYLLQHLGSVPSFAIHTAIQYNRFECVKLLLQDSRADPSAKNNIALMTAMETGNVKIVKLLLQDSRVNPTAAFNQAKKSNDIEMMELLGSYLSAFDLYNSNIDEEVKSVIIYEEDIKLIKEVINLPSKIIKDELIKNNGDLVETVYQLQQSKSSEPVLRRSSRQTALRNKSLRTKMY